MLELSEVSLTAGASPVLARISLTIPAGAPTAISGLGAAGREALARLLSGTAKVEGGAVRLNGVDIDRTRKEKGRIARLGAGGAVPSGQKVGKLIGAEAARSAGLSGQMDTKVSALSLDKRVRLALAQAIVGRPVLLILDAPASGVNEAARAGLIADLGAMLATYAGVAVILPGSADETLGLARDVIVLREGNVAQRGAVAEIATRPNCIASAAATAWPVLNTLTVMVDGERSLLPDGSRLQLPEGLPLPVSGACTLAIRPDDITLERASPGCVRFVVRGGAEDVRGGRTFLNVAFGGTSWLCPSPGAMPHAGAVLNAFVDASRLMIFDGEGRLREKSSA
jgi:ABC-type sugar transport system ATPase subunit